MSSKVLAGLLFVVLGASPVLGADQEADMQFARATAAFRAADYPEAEAVLSKLTSEHPSKGLYWFNLGNTFYLELKFGAAVKAYQQVVTLKSPLAPASMLGKAKSFRRAGDLDQAWNALEELKKSGAMGTGLQAGLKAEIETLSSETKRNGVIAYKDRDYEKALGYFTLLHLNNPSEKSEFLRGMCLFYIGDTPAASEIFGTLSRSAADPGLRAGSLEMIATLTPKQNVLPHPTGLVEISGGYNSNFFANGPGLPVISGPAEVSLLAMQFPWDHGESHNFETDMVVQDSEVAGYPSDRFLSGGLLTRLIWQSGDFTGEVSPEGQVLYIGTTPFMIKGGGRAHLTQAWGNDSLSLTGVLDRNFAPAGLYSYIGGYSSLAQLIYGHQFPAWRVEANVSYAIEQNHDYLSGSLVLPLSYTGPSLGMAVRYANSDLWSSTFQYNFYIKTYGTIEQPDDVQRLDNLNELSLRADRKISRTLSAFITAYLLLNQSTLGLGSSEDEDYHAYRTLLGVSWAFL